MAHVALHLAYHRSDLPGHLSEIQITFDTADLMAPLQVDHEMTFELYSLYITRLVHSLPRLDSGERPELWAYAVLEPEFRGSTPVELLAELHRYALFSSAQPTLGDEPEPCPEEDCPTCATDRLRQP